MKPVGWTVAAMASLLMVAMPAAAQVDASDSSVMLEDALHLWDSMDLEAAQATFLLVLENGETSTLEAARAYAHLATIAALLDADAEPVIRLHASAAVALDPRVLPPRDAPTSVRELFLELRDEREKARIVFQVERPGESRGRTVYAEVDGMPNGILSELLVRCGDFETVGDPSGFMFPLPAEGDIECAAEGVPGSGAVWVSSRQVILEDAPAEGRRWKLAVGIAAGVVALVGAGIAIGLSQRQEAEPDGVAPPFVFSWEGMN